MATSDSNQPTRPIGQRITAAAPTQPDSNTASHLPPGAVISHYRIESVLGQGGMGVVYLARQEKPDRPVALKVIRPGLAGPRLLRRFEQEAEVLGRLLHPGIAQIYEAGMADAGFGPQPFFAMELVRGQPLTQYASEKELSTRQRLELMAKVCDAVEHAHQKGVIHRDLKPGNILVTDEGQPKILDFGVARATDSDLQQTTMQTDVGALVGTLPYMSPEQVGGDPAELDTRSDVYALGVILFELLAGRLPYSIERRMIHEAARVIREEDPTRLSSINRTLRGDVETIVSHALEKDKSRRYQSASGLASDIRRYLAHEPITARPASTWYQLSKFSRRNRALVGGVAATFVVLVAGLAVSLYAFAEARYQSGLKDTALTLAKENEQKARDEAERARLAQEAEKQRADELDKVARFQAAQFEGLDTQLMGIRLRDDMIADAVSAFEKSGMPPEEVANAKAQLEEILARGNPTNVALKSLYDNIFERALKAVDEQFADQPLVRARLLASIGHTLMHLGMLDQAVEPLELSLSIHLELLGREHPDTIDSVHAVARLRAARGDLTAEVEQMLRDNLAIRSGTQGEDHPDTISSLSTLAFTLQEMGRLRDAEPLYRLVLEKRRSIHGAEHPDTLNAINNLGYLLQAQGKYADAEVCFREALGKSELILGPEHLDTINRLNNVAYTLHMQGKAEQAESYYRQVLEQRRRKLGDIHPDTQSARGNLAAVLDVLGEPGQAVVAYRELLETSRRTLGNEHPLTLTRIIDLATVLNKLSQFPEAEALCREAVTASERVRGAEHPDTLFAIDALCRAMRGQGDLGGAEPLMRQVLEGRRSLLGEDHPETIFSLAELGQVLWAQGRHGDAEPLLREALERRTRVLGPDHRDTLLSRTNLGVVLSALGKLDDPVPYFKDILESSRRALGPEHPDTLRYTCYFGQVLQANGLYAEAEPYHREAMEKRLRILGPAHPDTLMSIHDMGLVLHQLGRSAQAEPYLRQAWEGRRASLGEDHGATLVSLRSLAQAVMGQERLDDAEALLRNLLARHTRVRGEDDPTTLSSLTTLTVVLRRKGQLNDSAALLCDTIDNYERSFGKEHWQTGFARERLGLMLVELKQFPEAEKELLGAESTFDGDARLVMRRTATVQGLVGLYDAWHAAEPGKGYDAKAAEWRAKLEELQASTRPATQPAADARRFQRRIRLSSRRLSSVVASRCVAARCNTLQMSEPLPYGRSSVRALFTPSPRC